MALRFFLFSSDEGTSDLIRQVMTGLGVEGESCSQATTAADKLTRDLFQLVIIDWDQQPEAGMLLSAARERRVSERPLTIAVVSDDTAGPKALQAGANSILRKPVLLNQATDILTTARDLLRSRQESAASAMAAGAASSSTPTSIGTGAETSLRSGEFLQSTPAIPGGQYETDSEVAHFPEQSVAQDTDPLKDLEPVASAVPNAPPVLPTPPAEEPRGLEGYLRARGVVRQSTSVLGTSQAAAPAPARSAKPELLGYDQTPSFTGKSAAQKADATPEEVAAHEKKQAAQLFSYIAGEEKPEPEQTPSRFRIGKGPIIGALVLAACAIAAAPQAPWHGKVASLTVRGRRALHAWLNPTPVTTVTQAPASHEDFARAGDEYKLPVAETIPDATTDPSQISVVPVVDPTVKKAPADASTGQAATPDVSTTTPPEASQTNPGPATEQPVQTTPEQPQPLATTPATASPVTSPAEPSVHPEVSPASSPAVAPPSKPSPSVPRPQVSTYTPAPPAKVPSSLKSQIATMVPEASGNKPVEAALPTIEPVEVPETTERNLLIDQPPLAYPANAPGKQGTVTLRLLIGRDGIVQDAKFLQGSLAFARAAIDGVKQWRFKPYTVNGRPVSVSTTITLKFAPAQ